MVNKEKLYYKKSACNAICYRYPKDLVPDSMDDFIELDGNSEEFRKTLSCEYGKIWIIEDGKPVIVDDEEVQDSEDYKIFVSKNKRAEYQAYLDSTDYVISKLNESKLTDTDEEYQAVKDHYADVLAKRKEARKAIDALEER